MIRLRALAAAPFVLALAAHLLLFTLWYDRLPDPLATHFSATDGGRADGFTGLAAYAAISSGLLLLLGAGWVAFVRRSALWGAWATAGFTGGLLDLLLRDNLDAADAADVVSPFANFTVAAAIGALAGLAGWGLVRFTRLVPPEPVVPARRSASPASNSARTRSPAGRAPPPRRPAPRSAPPSWSPARGRCSPRCCSRPGRTP